MSVIIGINQGINFVLMEWSDGHCAEGPNQVSAGIAQAM